MAIAKGFTLKNGTGIQFSRDDELIRERIGRILMTNPLERVNNPNFGSLVGTYLFELPNILLQNIELEIRRRIEAYEPTVFVQTVSLVIDRDIANIKVIVIKRTDNQPLTFETSLSM